MIPVSLKSLYSLPGWANQEGEKGTKREVRAFVTFPSQPLSFFFFFRFHPATLIAFLFPSFHPIFYEEKPSKAAPPSKLVGQFHIDPHDFRAHRKACFSFIGPKHIDVG